MTKKERFQAVQEMRAPDYMPVWPRVMSQMIYSYGLLLPDVTPEKSIYYYERLPMSFFFETLPTYGLQPSSKRIATYS